MVWQWKSWEMDTGFSKNVASPAEMDWLPPGTHMVWVWVRKSSSTMGLISQKKAGLEHENWRFTINGRWYLYVYGIYILHIYICIYIYVCVCYIYIYTYAQMRNHLNRFSFVNYVNSATLMANVTWFPLLNIDMQSQQKNAKTQISSKALINYLQ